MTGSVQDIEDKLKAVEANRLILTGRVWSALQDEALLLSKINQVEAADALIRWMSRYPSATLLLLLAIEQTPGLPARLAPLFLRSVEFLRIHPLIDEQAQDVLRRALPELSPALRSVVFQQYPGLSRSDYQEGRDYVRLPESGDRPWPHEQNFPPLDTIEGRQARLRYLGHPTADPPGTWGIQSQAALISYQIASALPSLERWDEQTASSLDNEAIGQMCMYREDPSTVFDE